MMTPAEHYLEAQRILRGEVGGGITIDTAAEALALAQVHATLATVSGDTWRNSIVVQRTRDHVAGTQYEQR